CVEKLYARQCQVVRSQAITLQNCGSISTGNSLEVCSIAVAAKESIVGRFCETPRRLTQTPYSPIAHVAHRMTATGNRLATDTVALLYRRLRFDLCVVGARSTVEAPEFEQRLDLGIASGGILEKPRSVSRSGARQ